LAASASINRMAAGDAKANRRLARMATKKQAPRHPGGRPRKRTPTAWGQRIDKLAEQRGLSRRELAERVGITLPNLSILKTNKARAIRFSTLDAICRELDCQPGDLLEYEE